MMTDFNNIPSLSSLIAFESAARLGNFTAAAKELNSTQSAISQKIRRLEDGLGLTLFHRENRGAKLTASGKKLLEVVIEGLNSLSNGIEQAKNIPQYANINVATDYAFAAYWILPRLANFKDKYPHVEVSVITSEQFNPAKKNIDIAIAFGDGQISGYRSTLIFKEKIQPVCSPLLLQKHAGHSPHTQLTQLPLLSMGAGNLNSYFTWKTLFSDLNLAPPKEPSLTFNNYTLLLQAAIAGQGVAIGWLPLIDSLIDDNLLVPVIDQKFTSPQGYYALYPDNISQNPIVDAFSEWLIEESTNT